MTGWWAISVKKADPVLLDEARPAVDRVSGRQRLESVTEVSLNTPSRWSRRHLRVFAQPSMAWAIDSIANLHLDDDPVAIV